MTSEWRPTTPSLPVPPVDRKHAEGDGHVTASALLRAPQKRYSYLRYRITNGLILALSDVLALSCALLGAGMIRWWWLGQSVLSPWAWVVVPVWFGGATLLRLLPSWGLGAVEELRRSIWLLLVLFAAMIIVLFLSKQSEEASRLTLTIALLLSLPLVPYFRLQAKRLLIARGLWGSPVVVYGANETGLRVVEVLQRERGLGYNPVGLFDDDPARRGHLMQGVPVIGSMVEVEPAVEVAIVAVQGMGRERLVDLLEGPLTAYRSVMIVPDLLDVPSLWVRPRDLYGMLGLEITSNLSSPGVQLIKRVMSMAATLLTAPLLLPLGALVALLIKLEDGGSPFFTQERVGRGGRRFRAWKFRTMIPNAEAELEAHLARDEALRLEWETHHKLRLDPRVTRIGRFLRRFSLDELPQLYNVFRGEMALVGPRPLPPYHHNRLSPRTRHLRTRVRPGITGMWQVSGRSTLDQKGLEQWDAYYIRNWSLWLDIVIIIRTVRTVLKGTGAY